MKVRQYKDYIEITGYINAVDRYSRELNENGKKFFEKVEPGVWSKCITRASREKRPIYFYFNHDSQKLLGSTFENLELTEDEIGLKMKAIVKKENPYYQELLNNISSNRLTGFSFGFTNTKYEWHDKNHCTIKDMKLLEVSLLNCTPAYYGTVVQTRDKDGEQIHLRYGEGVDEMEELLKELIAEVKSLKEAILEDKEPKEEKEEKKEEPKEDETEDKVEPKEENEEVEEKAKEDEEPKEDEKPVENKEDDKEDKKQDEEPVDDKEDEEKAKEDEEKKRALIQSQLDFLR